MPQTALNALQAHNIMALIFDRKERVTIFSTIVHIHVQDSIANSIFENKYFLENLIFKIRSESQRCHIFKTAFVKCFKNGFSLKYQTPFSYFTK